jgi:hypothetical protein
MLIYFISKYDNSKVNLYDRFSKNSKIGSGRFLSNNEILSKLPTNYINNWNLLLLKKQNFLFSFNVKKFKYLFGKFNFINSNHLNETTYNNLFLPVIGKKKNLIFLDIKKNTIYLKNIFFKIKLFVHFKKNNYLYRKKYLLVFDIIEK